MSTRYLTNIAAGILCCYDIVDIDITRSFNFPRQFALEPRSGVYNSRDYLKCNFLKWGEEEWKTVNVM